MPAPFDLDGAAAPSGASASFQEKLHEERYKHPPFSSLEYRKHSRYMDVASDDSLSFFMAIIYSPYSGV